MSDLTVGAIVRPKSGGPKMTITEIIPDASGVMSVCATWLEEQDVKSGSFSIDDVEAVVD